MTLKKAAFQNIVGKGENAGKQDYPLIYAPISKDVSVCPSVSPNCVHLPKN